MSDKEAAGAESIPRRHSGDVTFSSPLSSNRRRGAEASHGDFRSESKDFLIALIALRNKNEIMSEQ